MKREAERLRERKGGRGDPRLLLRDIIESPVDDLW